MVLQQSADSFLKPTCSQHAALNLNLAVFGGALNRVSLQGGGRECWFDEDRATN